MIGMLHGGLRWGVVLTAAVGMVGAAGAAAKEPPLLTMVTLPNWLRSHVKPGHVLQVGLVGCHPDPRDPSLKPGSGFQMQVRDVRASSPLKADTVLAAWLRSAARVSLRCAPLEKGTREATLARAIRWAAAPAEKDHPALLYVPYEELAAPACLRSDAVAKAIAECWRVGCLPFTVTRSSPATVPPGVLLVSLSPGREGEKTSPSGLAERKDRPIALRLPAACLRGAPKELDRDRAAAAYLALAGAAVPADGRTAHLERAARLGQVTPVHKDKGREAAPYRIVDVKASLASRVTTPVPFLDKEYRWTTRLADLKEVVNALSSDTTTEQVERRILLSVKNVASLRHLKALFGLTSLEPIYLVPAREAILIARTSRQDRALRGRLVELLCTQVGKAEDCLFNAVAPDVWLERKDQGEK